MKKVYFVTNKETKLQSDHMRLTPNKGKQQAMFVIINLIFSN